MVVVSARIYIYLQHYVAMYISAILAHSFCVSTSKLTIQIVQKTVRMSERKSDTDSEKESERKRKTQTAKLRERKKRLYGERLRWKMPYN